MTKLRQHITKGCQIALENLMNAGEEQRDYYNQIEKLIILEHNDKVLLLLPKKTDTLLSSWRGPFTVVNKCSPLNYIVDVRGNHKLLHITSLPTKASP